MKQANICGYHVTRKTMNVSTQISRDLYKKSANEIKEKGQAVVFFGGVLPTGSGKTVYIYNDGVAVVGNEMNEETILLSHRYKEGLAELAKSLNLPLS